MRAAEINTTIVEGYIGLLDKLSLSNKLELISKLTDSAKTDLRKKESSFKQAFGALNPPKPPKKLLKKFEVAGFQTEKLNHFKLIKGIKLEDWTIN